MKRTYSSGELAKLCHISIRTVQYYDKENILKPSALSEGGRRIYTEDDLNKLRCTCLYKALGFSLGDIKKVMASSDAYSLLTETIFRQQNQIEAEIQLLQQTKARLAAISRQIEETGDVKAASIEEMDELLIKQKRHRKTDVMTYIFLGCYVLAFLTGFPLAASIGGFAPVIMGIALLILLLGLIYYHSQANAYVCPNCQVKFTISFFKDMLSLNGGKKGKYLACPNCKHKSWIKETFPE